MVIVIALAVGAILLMPLLTPKEENIEPEPTPEKLIYSDYRSDDVKEVTVQNEQSAFTLYKVDDQWRIKGQETIELDQMKAASIVQTASYVTAGQRVTDDMARASEFGLESSQATVRATFNDGVEHIYYLGDKAPDGSNYYMQMEGIDEIFTVWMNYGDNALTDINSLRKLAKLDITKEEVASLEVTNREGSYSIQMVEEENRISIFAWEVTEPYQRPVEAEPFDALLTDITALALDGVVEGNAADLAQYGLEEPWGRVSITNANDHNNTLIFGDDVDEHSVSVMFEGDSTVYKISKGSLSFMETTPWQVSDKMLSLIAVANVNHIDVTLPNTMAALDIEHVNRLDEEGKESLDGNGNPIQDHFYSLDGVKLSEEKQTIDEVEYDSGQEQAVWFYQALISLRIHSVLDDADYVGEKVAASIEYDIDNRDGEHNILFYEYNADFYAVKINDEDDYFLVSTLDVEDVEAKLAKLREGKLDRGY